MSSATQTFEFRRAVREGVHLIVGLIGGTGSGKTYSAMRLASGLSDGKPFAVIDTEAGRAKHYADRFTFDHGDLAAPFRPERYVAAIEAAAAAGYPVIVVDSMSHEHAGEGGLLDWHDEEFERMGAREAVKIAAWIKPKLAHKAMVARLLQLRAHLILCFRAEPKIRMEKDDRGKMQVVDAGWQPICAKGLEFELTASFLLSHERPGLPDHPVKLPESLRPMFPPGSPIDEQAGQRIAEWARGGAGTPATGPAATTPPADAMLAAFAKLGVTEADLAPLGGDLATLRAAFKRIRGGESKIAVLAELAAPPPDDDAWMTTSPTRESGEDA